jgi:hypothetical protein
MTAPQLFTVPPAFESAGAVLSSDGLYRYVLSRAWDAGSPLVTWVLLNPSTANAKEDDPTVRKLIAFSTVLGMSRLAVVNLFAWRATKPTELYAAPDPVGPHNPVTLRGWVRRAHLVVVGWGNHAGDRRLRGWGMVAQVREAAREAGRDLHCLGTNADGSPRHPLYLPYATPLTRWDP